MDKYAGLPYLSSFDMQQIVQGEEDMKIGLGQDDPQEFRRRRTESSLCCTSCKLCTDLQDQSLPRNPQESDTQTGRSG